MLPCEGSFFYYMSAHLPNSQYPRIVIIGAGFAGLRLAKKLSNKPFQVVLIDSYYLKLFNSQYQYKEKELVIPLFNITSDSYHLYAKQFTAHFTTKDYLAIKLVNEFYTNKLAKKLERKSMQRKLLKNYKVQKS